MKPLLDIVVCCTVLEQILRASMLTGSDEQMELARHIRQHRMLVSGQLMELCEQYFAENAPELSEAYRTFCAGAVQSETMVKLVPDVENPLSITSNPYYAELIGICQNSRDKLLLSEKKEKLYQIMARKRKAVQGKGTKAGQSKGTKAGQGKGTKAAKNGNELTILNGRDALEESFENPLFLYTLPVTGLMLRETQSNDEVAAWLKRFLEQESYVQIFDNYLFTSSGLRGFEQYILHFLPPDAELQIYTQLSGEVTEERIKQAVQKEKYKNRELAVYIVNSKKDLHERRIQGEHVIIQFDKGFAVFGKNGRIQKSPISVMESTNARRTVIPETGVRRIL